MASIRIKLRAARIYIGVRSYAPTPSLAIVCGFYTGFESLYNTPTQTGPVNLLGDDAHMFNATLQTLQGLLTLTLRQDMTASTLSSVEFTVINPVEVQEIQLTFLRVIGLLADTLAEQTGDVCMRTHSYTHTCMHRNTRGLTRIAPYTQSYLDTLIPRQNGLSCIHVRCFIR